MNPMLMFMLMGMGQKKPQSTTSLVLIGLVYAFAWSMILFFMWGTSGILIGLPATVAVCALLGYTMETLKLSPGDVAGIMIHVILAVAVIGMGISMFL